MENKLQTPRAEVNVGYLQRRIVQLDAELASFQAQVAAVTAERDADRCAGSLARQ